MATPSPEPESEGASSAAPAEDPEPDWLTGQDWVDEPLGDELDMVKTLAQPTYRSESVSAEVQAAFTDDVVLFGDTHANLYELDRATGELVWHVAMRSALPGGDTVCDLVVPSPTATTVVLNHGGGELCGNFTAYDLETGEVVDEYASLPEGSAGFGLASNSSLWRLGERVYWLDSGGQLQVLEDDGSSSSVGELPALLPGRRDYSVSALQLIPGTDVFMVRYREHSDGSSRGGPDDRNGGLLGFRVVDDSQVEEVWHRPLRSLTDEANSPGHRGHYLYLSDELPGTVQDMAVRGGPKLFRLRGVDAETGDLQNPGVLVRADSMRPGGPGMPGFAEYYGPTQVLVAGEGDVFSPFELSDHVGFTSLVRYDLATGAAIWRWQVPKALRAVAAPSMDVVSITPDRSSVYVRTSVDYDNRIWEIDYETGQPRRHWTLPATGAYRYAMDFAETYLDDGDVLQVNRYGSPDDRVLAALLRTGD
ncbi:MULTISPECIES: PQQ-binding-like beta-propeller repeat protein [unclassified Nocardioides]|uniref:outer membrane protein assembly factor BamB family protein n=1 Tax=unclassified Nocardioides TaxID=2615069 RepID=UPI0009F0408F|nr:MULTISPECIES: PQQ-binding-like beta-propeller repeat protein [unclassified Nocardioides]GAW48415.1 hypothetical protein PD653B2_0729 [Nocardioides sp. PD653-B2]GAW53340.1 hypothetical protein PD653_0739 [Nocardioides sp. PD653]